LTLVDFGRAIDLTQFAGHSGDPRNIMFTGEASSKEMQCVAMRSNLPWSYDTDTYGILTVAHILLYGSHMEIIMDQDGRWRPRASLKRYWKKELWTEIFESLLNLDDVGTAIGSRPGNLRALRRKIDAFLRTEKVQQTLRTLLTRQSKILPDNREKIEK
jgi:checkpoint serine/threonine-protein kinase